MTIRATPADAADPDRMPGLLAVMDSSGLLGLATDARIEELKARGTRSRSEGHA